MTKTWIASLSLVALLLAAPAALAHGANPPREIDTRIMADNDGLMPFGGCAQGQCLPGLESEGLDLVATGFYEVTLKVQTSDVYLDQMEFTVAVS